MFSCEFCEISKNTFFQRTTLVAASRYGPKYAYVKFYVTPIKIPK